MRTKSEDSREEWTCHMPEKGPLRARCVSCAPARLSSHTRSQPTVRRRVHKVKDILAQATWFYIPISASSYPVSSLG